MVSAVDVTAGNAFAPVHAPPCNAFRPINVLNALTDDFAPVLPYRVGDLDNDPAAGVRWRSDAISATYVPSTPAQTTLAEACG